MKRARLRLCGSFVAAAVLLVGCREPAAVRERALVIAQPGDVQSLDPPAITSAEAVRVINQIFEPLVRHSPSTMEIEPALATRWEVAADGCSWTFHLRRGVRFHDGTDFDADAVVFSFERQRDQRHPHHRPGFNYWKTTFSNIVETRKLDRYRVLIRTEKPFAPFLANLAIYPVNIVSPAAVRRWGAEFGRHPVGTGPYRFIAWEPGRRLVLRRNDDYWDGRPRVRRLVYRVVPEARRRMLGLQSGTIDVLFDLAPDDCPIVQLHPELRLLRAGGNNVAYLAMNTSRPPFDDVRVRRAVSLAVNTRRIRDYAYQGLAKEARGPLPQGTWSHADLPRRRYDPGRARQQLARIGFDSSRTVRLYAMNTPRPYLPSPVLVARMIVRDLAAVGIRAELVIQSHAEHQRAVRRGEHDMCLLGWVGDSGDPDNFLYVLLDRDNARAGAAQNVAFFTDIDVHRLLVAARQEMRRGRRAAYYRKAQRLIHERAPWVPLAHADLLVGVRAQLRGVALHPTATVYFGAVSFR